MTIIDDAYINIKRNRILGRIGSIKNKDDAKLNTLIDECILKSRELIQPIALFKTLPIIRRNEESIILSEEIMIDSKSIYQITLNCDFISIYTCSINSLLENYLVTLLNNQLKQLIFDSIGSEATEEMANIMNQQINQLAKSQGYSLTLRRSPGFSDFNLDFQNEIVKLLDSEKYGITINEHNFLIPRKSTSGIIGWEKRK